MSPRIVSPRVQRGLTLVELMISITISLIIVAALGYVYTGSRAAYRTNENLARMQESGRFALDFLAEDLRMASFYGCRSRRLLGQNIFDVARPAAGIAPSANRPPNSVRGFESGSGWTNDSTITRVNGTDVVTIWRAGGVAVEMAEDTDPANARVTLANNLASFKRGDYVMLANCSDVNIFRITNDPTPDAATGVTVLEHGANLPTGASTGGNGNNSIVSGADSHKLIKPMARDSRAVAYHFSAASYFIGTNPAGRPALYRVTGGAAEELAENIEDMDLMFGVDTTSDGVADSYVKADAVADWTQVVAVRVALLAASTDTAAATAPQSYVLRDTNSDGALDRQTAADTRLRQVFSTTVAIRNRIQ